LPKRQKIAHLKLLLKTLKRKQKVDPRTRDNCILLGTLAKPYGTKGSVLVRCVDLTPDDIKKRETVFLDIDGMLVPFFIEVFQERSRDMAILKLDGIDTESRAREFSGCQVYVRKDQVKRKKRVQESLPDLTGYRVQDLKQGYMGLAGKIIDIANNPLLEVHHEGRDFLVPFHDDIIREIDHNNLVIVIEAPEGLFEL
jgi:16S rRNA processing protein RimM